MNDLIYRQDVIDALDVNNRFADARCPEWYVDAIEQIPSAEKTGKWIKENRVFTSNPPQYVWYCSECSTSVYGFSSGILTPYCPYCGAKMEVEK